ncbi:ADR241Cp [Eremothecium gossypii ATCC 10895]|uniref:ADR241Cp n=1 Tax=Eremothecium gossypii (strain ATCC 10895 / CBS 109.51 / FGSC 9923 / NRRL Y-1056) TaxID=284811 RepID=Q759N4_EREGS|nr:ADR241Cp [Eremothecium gossypii ATCC 10895]AAS52161.1 ADR241Cp [Eremothecium gossypii ATCC 10895]AEY96460.1 FADR241Cp [Eremothecium gossypii FDAG1]
MRLWPFEPFRASRLPKGEYAFKQGTPADSDGYESILEIGVLSQSNLVIVLTETRVLVYNAKPMALVACHERTNESVEKFGLNKKMYNNMHYGTLLDEVVTKENHKSFNVETKGVFFYIMTSDNFLLVYQVLAGIDGFSVYTDYGVACDRERHHLLEKRPFIGDESTSSVLTVFDKNDGRTAIQNGYVTGKTRGFFEFWKGTGSANEELPVKKHELRLRVVLKFDYPIHDMFGAYSIDSTDEEEGQFMVLLLSDGVKHLHLSDFKLNKSSLIEIKHGHHMVLHNGDLFVAAQDAEYKVSINRVSLGSQEIHTDDVPTSPASELIAVYAIYDILVLAYESELLHYNVKSKTIKRSKLSLKIRRCHKEEDLLILLTQDNRICISTIYGNILFSSDFDMNGKSLACTSLNCFDNTILIGSADGHLITWPMWQEISNQSIDFKHDTPLILCNKHNDLMISSPLNCPTLEQNLMQVISLPLKELNNHILAARLNGPQNLLAVYISNRNILLLHFLHSNRWKIFHDVTILEIVWLGNHFLLCHMANNEGDEWLQCYQFSQKAGPSEDLEEYSVWRWEIPYESKLQNIFVTTCPTLKPLKVKSKTSDESGLTLFKTAELLLLCEDGSYTVFDVISFLHPAGVETIKRFHQSKRHKLPEEVSSNVRWLLPWKGQLLVLDGDTLYRVGTQDEQGYANTSVIMDSVERVIDCTGETISVLTGNQLSIFTVEELANKDTPQATVPVSEDEYPVFVNPSMALVYNVQCSYRDHVTKMALDQHIYLDQVISRLLEKGLPGIEIHEQYSMLRHYPFVLEKVLSTDVLANRPLAPILQLIDIYDEAPPNKASWKMEIVSNCLRKIETKHWDYLFEQLGLTPMELLVQCTENGETKILGMLLMVFLNYDETSTGTAAVKPVAPKADIPLNTDKNGHLAVDNAVNSPISAALQYEGLIQKVLKVIVTSAGSALTPLEAQEYWDMALQIMRFVKALDKQNGSTLVEDCLQQL